MQQDDLVEKLREWARSGTFLNSNLMLDAADEIEQLRKALDLAKANLDEMDCDMRDGRY